MIGAVICITTGRGPTTSGWGRRLWSGQVSGDHCKQCVASDRDDDMVMCYRLDVSVTEYVSGEIADMCMVHFSDPQTTVHAIFVVAIFVVAIFAVLYRDALLAQASTVTKLGIVNHPFSGLPHPCVPLPLPHPLRIAGNGG